ncbi:hypothetical protein [Crocosphaera sp. Alani8]|uniref:hypothetical protein n=1 Tax=Crocosphaera sp. Alani8 TaxID=3038952 RepID=UPI00313EC95E
MARKADILFNDFKSRVQERDRKRNKIEELFTNNILDQNDIFIFYDGLFIGLFTDFEKFIEELFLGLLQEEITINECTINEICKVTISPKSEINSVILAGQRYLNWLPYEKTIERARIFFHDGIPFTNLDSDQKNNLRYYHRIRNAIAHKSPKAEADFYKIIQNLPLLPSQKTPAGYLRSKPRGQETQYEIASTQLIQIALDLCRITV